MREGSIIDRIYAAHRYLSEIESEPRDYGTGEPLYASEIHTVVAVRAHPGCNLTALAAALGVSKPAAYKFAAKMIRRGFLRKYQEPGNRKDVFFNVSDTGAIAAEGHERFERETFGPLRRVEEELSPDARAALIDYFERLGALIG